METHGAAIFQGSSCASPASKGARGGCLFHRSRLRLVLALERKGVTLCKAGVWVGFFFPSSITFSLSFTKQVSMGHLLPPVPSPSDLLDWLRRASPSLGSCRSLNSQLRSHERVKISILFLSQMFGLWVRRHGNKQNKPGGKCTLCFGQHSRGSGSVSEVSSLAY